MQDFTRLHVWQRTHRLALRVYAETLGWGRGHGALASQTRRAAMSIGANITEGCGKDGRTELARFLDIARGSASELQHHLRFAADLGLLDAHAHASYDLEVQGVRRMLTGLIASVRDAPGDDRPPSTGDPSPTTS